MIYRSIGSATSKTSSLLSNLRESNRQLHPSPRGGFPDDSEGKVRLCRRMRAGYQLGLVILPVGVGFGPDAHPLSCFPLEQTEFFASLLQVLARDFRNNLLLSMT